VVQLLSYYCNARYYQAFFEITGHKVNLRRLYEASLAVNFANQTIPSGGVSGTTYLAQAIKNNDVQPGQATVAQLGRYIFTYLSFFLVLGAGFLMLFMFGNDLNKASVKIVILFMLMLLAIGTVLLTIFSERSRMHKFLSPVIAAVNWIARKLFRHQGTLVKDSRIDTFLDDFYESYHVIMSHKGHWPKLLLWTLLGNIAEVTTIYVVFVGFGHWINPGIVVTGYTFAIIASLGGLILGGFGVYEAGMIGTFSALGVPFALAFAVVIVYRVLNMAMFLPIGLYYYRKHLKEAV
jgi:uncharacterized protein (TIRG00374 family)